ncbi:MAG TPA: hypothetical protein VFG20_21085 [Planctomycetaceae bacterium]|nr:hypothetical protein [Planctomycetaceae bacterium]
MEQLLTDFQTLNEQAMAIHAKLAMIALQLAGAGSKAQKRDQSMTDTVEF